MAEVSFGGPEDPDGPVLRGIRVPRKAACSLSYADSLRFSQGGTPPEVSGLLETASRHRRRQAVGGEALQDLPHYKRAYETRHQLLYSQSPNGPRKRQLYSGKDSTT